MVLKQTDLTMIVAHIRRRAARKQVSVAVNRDIQRGFRREYVSDVHESFKLELSNSLGELCAFTGCYVAAKV
jgi:hypothetical protein